jgi:ubiquinone/menaquinone biosynthesis C-methylase UbiE
MRIISEYLGNLPDVDLGAGKKPKAKISLDINGEFKPNIVADVQHLPLRSVAFDSVVCSHVLEHTADPSVALDEIRRVLRRNGRVAFFLPDDKSKRWRMLRPFWSRYYEHAVSKENSPETHLQSFDYENFKNLLERFFKLIKVDKINFGMELYAICECL